MSSKPWYKRYPSDFMNGTTMLTFEEKGAYAIILDLLYDKGGAIDDDPKWIAYALALTTRRWAPIRAALIAKGKLISENGKLTNSRTTRQLFSQEKTPENPVKHSRKLRETESVSNKNNGLFSETENTPETRNQKPEKRDTNVSQKIGLEDLTIDHIRDWLNEKRAVGLFLTVDEHGQLEYFKDYCRAKSPKYKDYPAAFRNSFKWNTVVTKGNQNGKSKSDIADEATARALARASQRRQPDSSSSQAELRYLPYLREGSASD